jgi:hypothetical protein
VLAQHFPGHTFNYTQAKIALRLLAEERVGTRIREAEAREDAAVARALSAVKEQHGDR